MHALHLFLQHSYYQNNFDADTKYHYSLKFYNYFLFDISDFDNLKYTEIADLLNISIKTVESQIRTAFIKIRTDEKSTNFINLFINFKYKIALKFHL